MVFNSVHLHSNGHDVRARQLLGFKFFPVGYKPTYKYARRALGDAVNIDIPTNEANQRLDAYQVLLEPTEIVSFEPRSHAPGHAYVPRIYLGHRDADAELHRFSRYTDWVRLCPSTRMTTGRFYRRARFYTSSPLWITARIIRTWRIRRKLLRFGKPVDCEHVH